MIVAPSSLVAVVLYLAVAASAVGTEHTVDLDKGDIRTMMEESKHTIESQAPRRFTFAASSDKPQAGPRRTKWTASDVEELGPEESRVNVTLTVDRRNLLSIAIEFVDNSTISAPDFRVSASYVDDAQHNRYLVHPSEVHPTLDQRRHVLPLKAPFSLGALDNLKVGVFVFARLITTYRYDIDVDQLVEGTNASVASGLLYELVPPFSTMRIMFLTQHDRRSDVYSLWVTRRPPMPKCTIAATTDDEILFVEHVATAKPWGVALRSALAGPSRRRYTAPIRLIAHFYERRRSRRADFVIPGLGEILRTPRAEGRPAALISTDVEGLTLRPQLAPDGKSVSLLMASPSPMVNALLQLRVDATFVHCEEVSHPPPGEPFEWKMALSTNDTLYEAFADSTSGVRGVLLFDWSKYDEDTEEALRHWVHTYGGDLRSVFFSKTSSGAKRSNSSNVVRVRVPLNVGAPAAMIPYTLLLTSTVVEGSPAVQELKADKDRSEALERECEQLGVPFASAFPMLLLSYYVMLGEPHPDTGMTWRPLYDSLPLQEPTSTPLFFSSDELSLFDFEPEFRRKHDLTLRLYRAEYAAISAHAPWLVAASKDQFREFPRRWSEQDYFALRSQIAARARNMSGVITVVPAFDGFTHSSHPNARLLFDNDLQGVRCLTQRAVSAGEELSVDYGWQSRSRLDFYFQYGILSRQSADAALLPYTLQNGGVLNVSLSMGRSSIEPLLRALGEEGDEPAQVRFAAIKVLNDAKRKLGGTAPTFGDENQSLQRNIIEECASALFASRKDILSAHIRWLSDM